MKFSENRRDLAKPPRGNEIGNVPATPPVHRDSVMSEITWHGIFPAVTTHFHGDQALDLPGTLRHLDAMLAAGIDGVIMLGTVGENCSLEYREKLDVLKATIEHVRRRVPVLT